MSFYDDLVKEFRDYVDTVPNYYELISSKIFKTLSGFGEKIPHYYMSNKDMIITGDIKSVILGSLGSVKIVVTLNTNPDIEVCVKTDFDTYSKNPSILPDKKITLVAKYMCEGESFTLNFVRVIDVSDTLMFPYYICIEDNFYVRGDGVEVYSVNGTHYCPTCGDELVEVCNVHK